MSKEAENEATNRIIETYRSANSAMAKIEGEMSMLSKNLEALAKSLRSPASHLFQQHSQEIQVYENVSGPPYQRRVSLSSAQYDWKSLKEMLENYETARRDKQENATRLRNMGLDLKD